MVLCFVGDIGFFYFPLIIDGISDVQSKYEDQICTAVLDVCGVICYDTTSSL